MRTWNQGQEALFCSPDDVARQHLCLPATECVSQLPGTEPTTQSVPHTAKLQNKIWIRALLKNSRSKNGQLIILKPSES
jgi:hypothetical protein